MTQQTLFEIGFFKNTENDKGLLSEIRDENFIEDRLSLLNFGESIPQCMEEHCKEKPTHGYINSPKCFCKMHTRKNMVKGRLCTYSRGFNGSYCKKIAQYKIISDIVDKPPRYACEEHDHIRGVKETIQYS